MTFSQDIPDYFQPIQFIPSFAGNDIGRLNINSQLLSADRIYREDFVSISYDKYIKKTKNGIGVILDYKMIGIENEKSLGLIYTRLFEKGNFKFKPGFEFEIFNRNTRYFNKTEIGIHLSLLFKLKNATLAFVSNRVNRPYIATYLSSFNPYNISLYSYKSLDNMNFYFSYKIKLSNNNPQLALLPEFFLNRVKVISFFDNYHFVGTQFLWNKLSMGLQIVTSEASFPFVWNISYRIDNIKMGFSYNDFKSFHIDRTKLNLFLSIPIDGNTDNYNFMNYYFN